MTDTIKKAMVFGAFDPLHKGHINYFKQAKAAGDYVVAVVARDETIRKIKKREPFQNENERLEKIKKLPIIDKAALGDKKDMLKAIREEQPDILCLGYDQKINKELLKKLVEEFPRIRILRMKPFRPELYKSAVFRKKSLFSASFLF